MHMETTYLLFIAIYGVESFTYRGGTYTSFDYNTTTETCIVRECSTFNSWEDTYGECNEFTPITSALGQQYILNEDGDCMRHWSCDVSELRWFEGSAWPISGMCRCPKCSCDVEGDTQWVREEHDNGQISCTECTCDENLFFGGNVWECERRWTISTSYRQIPDTITDWCPNPRCRWQGYIRGKDESWWDHDDETCQTFCTCTPHNRTCMRTVCGHLYEDILHNDALSSAFGVYSDTCRDTSQWKYESNGITSLCRDPDTGPEYVYNTLCIEYNDHMIYMIFRCPGYTATTSKAPSVTSFLTCLSMDDADTWDDANMTESMDDTDTWGDVVSTMNEYYANDLTTGTPEASSHKNLHLILNFYGLFPLQCF
eukprot:315806_1